MNPGGEVLLQPQGAMVEPNASKLGEMNQSAAENASAEVKGVLPCEKKSWFAIRVVDDKDTVVEGLTLKLKVTDLGDIDRITSKGVDPIRIEGLAPGGQGDVKYIDCGEVVWEAIGDIT